MDSFLYCYRIFSPAAGRAAAAIARFSFPVFNGCTLSGRNDGNVAACNDFEFNFIKATPHNSQSKNRTLCIASKC